jgi:hypothetical protein
MGVIPRLNRFRVLLDKKEGAGWGSYQGRTDSEFYWTKRKELDGGHTKVEQIPSFTRQKERSRIGVIPRLNRFRVLLDKKEGAGWGSSQGRTDSEFY